MVARNFARVYESASSWVQTDRTHHWKTVLAGAIGNVLEWYDFALFGYFAPVLSRLFFLLRIRRYP